MSFDARPVVLFGANGAGKTNVLEAISMLSPGRGLKRASSDEMIRKPETLGWKILAEIETQGDTREIETWAEPLGARQVTIDGKAATQLALGKIAPMLWLVPAMDRLWIEGADGRRKFLDRMVLSFVPEHAEATLTYEKAMRERNRLLKDQVADEAWYRTLESQLAENGALITANRASTLARVAAATGEVEEAFPAADLALTNAEGDIPVTADELRSAYAETRRADLAAGRTLIGPHRADMQAVWRTKQMPADQCSTGEQKALLISLILGAARAMQRETGRAPILLLDEIAAHLDLARRATLYDLLLDLGAQCFMTGTGPELFAELGDRAQMFSVGEADGASKVTEMP
jgi:DNA replication and repair protein RecF